MCRKPVAEEYLRLTEVWNNTDKETIINNTIKHLCDKFPECKAFNERHRKLAELTQSNKHTAYAWLNLSRDNVKIPLLKLCMIAEALDVDVMEFLKTNNNECEV